MDLTEKIRKAEAALLKLKEEQSHASSVEKQKGLTDAREYLLGKAFINKQYYNGIDNKPAKMIRLSFIKDVSNRNIVPADDKLVEVEMDVVEMYYKEPISATTKNRSVSYIEGETMIKHIDSFRSYYKQEIDIEAYLKTKNGIIDSMNLIYTDLESIAELKGR